MLTGVCIQNLLLLAQILTSHMPCVPNKILIIYGWLLMSLAFAQVTLTSLLTSFKGTLVAKMHRSKMIGMYKSDWSSEEGARTIQHRSLHQQITNDENANLEVQTFNITSLHVLCQFVYQPDTRKLTGTPLFHKRAEPIQLITSNRHAILHPFHRLKTLTFHQDKAESTTW